MIDEPNVNESDEPDYSLSYSPAEAVIDQDEAEELLEQGVTLCKSNNKEEGLRYIDQGLAWFRDNNVDLPFGYCYTVGLELNNVKDINGNRIPERQDEAIRLMERAAGMKESLEQLKLFMGSSAVEIFYKILSASKNEQAARNRMLGINNDVMDTLSASER
jgi:hypothetical protein